MQNKVQKSGVLKLRREGWGIKGWVEGGLQKKSAKLRGLGNKWQIAKKVQN